MSKHECKYFKRDSEGILRCVVCAKPSTRDKMHAENNAVAQSEIGTGVSCPVEVKTDRAEIEDKAIHVVEDKAIKTAKKKRQKR